MGWNRDELSEFRGRPDLALWGITTPEELWRAIGKDKGIRDLVQATGVDRSQLIEDLTALARRRAEEKGTSWLRRHMLDLLLIGALLLGGWLVVRAVPIAGAVGVALRDLRQGERLSGEAVHRALDPESSPGLRLKRTIRKGEYVFLEDLEPLPSLKPEELRGRMSLRLPVEPADVRRLPSLPGRATFAIVSQAAESTPTLGHIFRDVPVLSIEREKGSAFFVVALNNDQVRTLLPLLHEPRVFLLRPPP